MRRVWLTLACCLSIALPAAASAETLREEIAKTAFLVTDKRQAIAEIAAEIGRADAEIAADPKDPEARLQRGVALGYRAKLTKNRDDAVAARQTFEALAKADPRNPELHLALATWHLDSVDQLGGLIAGAVIGAKKSIGEAELDKAVAFGRDRAFILGAAALLRMRADDSDLLRSRQLAEAAQKAPAPTGIDRVMKRAAAVILPALVAGDGSTAKRLAKTLMPFGKLK
jgi:hypothetical protein